MKMKKRTTITVTGSQTLLEQLPAFSRPKFADTLRFPDDITHLDAQNVSELLGKYTLMLCYVQEQHAKFTVKLLALEAQQSKLESNIFLSEPQIAHLERWRRDQKVNADHRMIALVTEIARVRGHKEIAWSFMQNYERCINALSRELTRKMASHETKSTRYYERA